ncbi:ras-related protein Rab-40B [Daphnia magna]|uniref:Ras-related protein Rab-40C n=2 Tax=Daphnia magna TaxID=35525 RepID=A0A164UMH6_9CRUS|nr:ras-related protein Rab-40B [Daphnia magna]XP_032782394.1 ras-related protein Rab-40B [Daphnia magna]KAK4011367.1 hypothetical protein OUZ56_020481 [Daphnia magna]KZS11496.1 Ras-related protein Rab-40C [Daphnia magna]
MVQIRVQGETIGAFPVSDLPLPIVETVDAATPSAVSDLVEVVSTSRLRRSRQSASLLPVPRPIPTNETISPILAPQLSAKPYDYLLKFLLVGDSDVGKQEILSTLENAASDMPFCAGPVHKVTTLLVDGRRVRLQLWDTSGQGRFCTILRSYSRGAQGLLLVYDLTNKWSFDGIDRWRREVEEHAPGVPKVLVGNRLHLEFKRAVSVAQAEAYAQRHGMAFFEISPLCNYNVAESLAELTRRALRRNGMERLWRTNRVLSLQELCCRSIVSQTSVYTIDRLPLPPTLHSQLRSYALSSGCARHHPHHPNHHHEMKMAIKKSRLSHVHAKLTCVIS